MASPAVLAGLMTRVRCRSKAISIRKELGADWECCFLLQSRDVANIQSYNFTYLGERIMNAYFDKSIDEHNQFMVGPNAFRLSKHFQQVLESKTPVHDHGEFQTLHGNRVLYRQVFLPLGGDKEEVEAIFGGMNARSPTDALRSWLAAALPVLRG